MKTTRLGGARRFLTGLTVFGATAALGMAAGAAGGPLQAQETRADPECRCVDADGNEIENCTCFRTFDAEEPWIQAFTLGTNRARMGISVDVHQGASDDARGARVTDVMDGGPADDAGLREGDLITRIGDHSLFDPLEADIEEDFDLDESIPVQRLLALARELEPGEDVEVEYLRDGEPGTTALTAEELSGWGRISVVSPRRLGEGLERLRDGLRLHSEAGRPRAFFRDVEPGRVRAFRPGGHEGFDACPPSADEGNVRAFFRGGCPGGVELLELNPRLAESFGTEGGVLVVDVHPESPLGLEAGDVIRRIGDRAVDSEDKVRRILRSYELDEEISFHVVRDGREMSVAGRLGR